MGKYSFNHNKRVDLSIRFIPIKKLDLNILGYFAILINHKFWYKKA